VDDRRTGHLGGNARAADETTPAVEQGGHCVIVRGRLELTDDGLAVLGQIPAETAGTWVNLYIRRENIALHSYEL
jgi:hypothetical protein